MSDQRMSRLMLAMKEVAEEVEAEHIQRKLAGLDSETAQDVRDLLAAADWTDSGNLDTVFRNAASMLANEESILPGLVEYAREVLNSQ